MRLLTPVVVAATLAAAASLLGAGTGPVVVSVGDDGSHGPAAARGAAISASGRYVAFTSTDGLAGVAVSGTQLYVRDRSTGRTVLASSAADGSPADAPVDDPAPRRAYAISGDGRYVVFASAATNLDPGDADGGELDVFRKDLATGAIATVSRAPDGTPADGPVAGDPDISYDGGRVVYATGPATNLWPGDPGPASDIVVRDMVAALTVHASVAGDATALTGVLEAPVISADGAVVAFTDDGAVVVRDLAGAATIQLGPGAEPDLSATGAVVVFESAGAVVRFDRGSGASTVAAASGVLPRVSADGARVAFQTSADLGGDTNGVADLYVRDGSAPAVRVSARPGGPDVQRPATRPALSANGGVAAFTLDDGSPSDSPDPTDTDHAPDAIVAPLGATDAVGPRLEGLPAGGTTTSETLVVSGTATDPSAVVAVTVGGARARLSASGAFAVEVPLVGGPNGIRVAAVDAAGNVSEHTVAVIRAEPLSPAAPAKSRGTVLRVYRAGRATVVRFRLGPGAARVTVRLWRSVPRRGRLPLWVPADRARPVGRAPGVRTALVSRARLRPGLYQARITVASEGGVAVATARYRVTRRSAGA